MKIVLSLVCAFVAASAFACPNLSGNFQCNDFENGAVQDVVISQSMVEGATQYTLQITQDGETSQVVYLANGETVTTQSEDWNSLSERVYCEADQLIIKTDGIATDGAVFTAAITAKIDADGNFWNSYVGSMSGEGFDYSETCVRTN